MKFSYWLVIVGLGILTGSCSSGYIVSNNAYNPNLGEKEHYTVEGVKIPKASNIIKNQFEVPATFEEVQLTAEGLNPADLGLEVPSNNQPNAISYTAYAVVDEAKTYLGTPYRYGGTSRRGIDCSAFTQKVFESNNIWLPRVARLQANEGSYVSKSELQKGDLLFFITRGRMISHVGIVESVEPDGEIKFIHASSSQGVTISSLSSGYWASKYQYAKRII